MTRHGKVRPGVASLVRAWRLWLVEVMPGGAGLGRVWQFGLGWAGQGLSGQDWVWQFWLGSVWLVRFRQGAAWPGLAVLARSVFARQGAARLGMVGSFGGTGQGKVRSVAVRYGLMRQFWSGGPGRGRACYCVVGFGLTRQLRYVEPRLVKSLWAKVCPGVEGVGLISAPPPKMKGVISWFSS